MSKAPEFNALRGMTEERCPERDSSGGLMC